MPTYCYRSRDKRRKVIQRVFSAEDKPESFVEKGVRYDRARDAEWGGISVPASAGWPMECVASGVHPSQRKELESYFRSHGVPTEVSADGNPIYKNAAHRRKALKVRGFHDKASYL